MMMMADYNETHEDEANCLAGTLLVPRVALIELLGQGYDTQRAADYFGVTSAVLQMRRNLTGVDLQMSRRRRRAG
jgi:Zn-dependent peptidase ImmA (M78 family)